MATNLHEIKCDEKNNTQLSEVNKLSNDEQAGLSRNTVEDQQIHTSSN